MLDDLLGKLGGSSFDVKKMIDVVDDLWDQRDKIVDVVNFVWDNKDEIVKAMEFARDHADQIVELGAQLPTLLANAGSALETAGDGAHTASLMLLGRDGGGVGELANDAAAALDRCHEELREVMELFDRAGGGLAKVPLIGEVADPIVDGAERIGAVADDLSAVAGRVRGLGSQITEAGNDLGWVGDSLGSSGSVLRRLDSDRSEGATYLFDADAALERRPAGPNLAAGLAPTTSSKKASSKKTSSKKASSKKTSSKKSS